MSKKLELTVTDAQAEKLRQSLQFDADLWLQTVKRHEADVNDARARLASLEAGLAQAVAEHQSAKAVLLSAFPAPVEPVDDGKGKPV